VSVKLGVQKRSSWLVQNAAVKGVFVGGCVSHGIGSRFRAKAHAHLTGPHAGWLCFLSTKWLHVRELWVHEIAHIVAGEGHTEFWRTILIQIGGTLDAVSHNGQEVLRSYHKDNT
jgi:hypothetical protein